MTSLIIMPETVSLGFSGGPTFNTDKLPLKNGGRRRIKRRDDPLHVYTFTYDDRSDTDVIALRNFFVDRRGDFEAFLFKDWMDFSVTAGQIGVGDAANKNFQCVQVVGSDNPYTRVIRHLKSGTLSVYVNGVLKTLTSDYTVSSSALVSFITAPGAAAVVTASFEFYVPVSFDGDAFTERLAYRTLSARAVSGLTVIEVLGE